MTTITKSRATVVVLILSSLVTGCEAEPLSPETEQRLERVYRDLPERQAIGIIQNLRFTGLYSGPLEKGWRPEMALAINQVHHELDMFDGHYDLSSYAGANAFLADLSTGRIRERLINELSVTIPQFTQISPPETQAHFKEGQCRVGGGRYERNGERVDLTFTYEKMNGAVHMRWDGWPGGILPHASVDFGSDSLPAMMGTDAHGNVTELNLFNLNNFWIVNLVKRGTQVSIKGEYLGEMKLPTGDLYQTGIALEKCVQKHFPNGL